MHRVHFIFSAVGRYFTTLNDRRYSLTYRKRENVKKQSYINQISREKETSIALVCEVKFNEGVNIND